MEYGRQILPSSFESRDLSLEDPSRRTRQPLSSSAGNAQLNTLASAIYHEDKGNQSRFDGDGHMYPLTTLPSQPARPAAGYTLAQRKQHFRHQREQKHVRQARNPIVDSPQYQAYRERATREGNPDDQKWPDVLEDAFLDALLIMPIMGRRKFSYRGKPHGRNELIAEYLWIYYLQSLGPGETPDPSMRRYRKQVSSHIQVIKAFLKSHPDFLKVFPPAPKPENGFQDSFKNDPCLRAISEGRLPSKRFHRFSNTPGYNEDFKPVRTLRSGPVRPSLFWLIITPHDIVEDRSGRFDNEEDLHNANVVVHKFSSLSSELQRGTLDSISHWQHKFPDLEHLRNMGELNCDIIHMDVALDLMTDHPGEGAELVCKTEFSIPGRAPDGCEWRSLTTFTKPPELCQDSETDPALVAKDLPVSVMPSNDAETRLKVPFPATAWANAFIKLIKIHNRHQARRGSRGFSDMPTKSARQCIEELSMCQEIICSTPLSSSGDRSSFIRKAIILWTFHKTRPGEGNHTPWRYIDASPPPPRRACMSPSPHSSHQVSAAMYENFNSFVEPLPSMLLQQPHHPSMLADPFAQGLATPPLTGGLQSPFNSQSYSFNPNLSFDMPSENLSFMSCKTADSESTLVEDKNNTSQIDHYLSNNINLGDYDQNANWQIPAASENFDADPAWGSYEANQTPQISWSQNIHAPSTAALDHAKSQHQQDWHDLPAEAHQQHQQQRKTSWIDESGSSKHDWLAEATATSSNSPEKRRESYAEQNLEQRLLPWIENHDASRGTNSTNNNPINVTDAAVANSILELSAGQEAGKMVDDNSGWGGGGVELEGNGDDGFDYSALAERLK